MENEDDPIERWWQTTPEPKLELIDGQLIVGTLRGSRRMLWTLLRDYGPGIALPLAPAESWWAALREGFRPRPEPSSPEEWATWADTRVYDPEPEPAGPHGSVAHRRVNELLRFALHDMARGSVLGRDVVVRLGEDGLTPDLFWIDPARPERMREYYLDGPPALIIEITLESSAQQDRSIKRQLYEAAGIPEYWIIEADDRQALFLRRAADGRYSPAAPDDGEIYHSVAVPGLALSLPHLWQMKKTDWDHPHLPFLPPPRFEERTWSKRSAEASDLTWGSLPFAPRVDLRPVPIRFAEYISWCPEAKFEGDAGGAIIGSPEGSRHVLGLLLMTFGLVEAVRRAHPRDWVVYLNPQPYEPEVQRWTERLLPHAVYRSHDMGRGETYHHAHIPPMPEVSAGGLSRIECELNLVEELRHRVLLRLARRRKMPDVS